MKEDDDRDITVRDRVPLERLVFDISRKVNECKEHAAVISFSSLR